jgi:hypothetical protein
VLQGYRIHFASFHCKTLSASSDPYLWELTSVTLASLFHHAWCNSIGSVQSYVKEALQAWSNVLLSGPFSKVSERPTERYSFNAQRWFFMGGSAAIRQT